MNATLWFATMSIYRAQRLPAIAARRLIWAPPPLLNFDTATAYETIVTAKGKSHQPKPIVIFISLS